MKINKKKSTDLIGKKWAENINRGFTETEYQKANKCIEEMLKIISNQRNAQLNNIDTSLCTSLCQPGDERRLGSGRGCRRAAPGWWEWTAWHPRPAPPSPVLTQLQRGQHNPLWAAVHSP